MSPTHCTCKGCDACTPCTGCDCCNTAVLRMGHCAAPRGSRGAKCKACTPPRCWSVKSDTIAKVMQKHGLVAAQPAAAFLHGAASASVPIVALMPVFEATLPAANTLTLAVPAAAVSAAHSQPPIPSARQAAPHSSPSGQPQPPSLPPLPYCTSLPSPSPASPDSAAMLNSLAAVAAMLPRAIDPNEGRKVGEG